MENKKYCDDCGKHYILSNWSHHIKTKKHINNCSENKKDTYIILVHIVILFSHASSLSRHKKEVHDQVVVYNYHCKECDIYLKDKTASDNHRQSSKHKKILLKTVKYNLITNGIPIDALDWRKTKNVVKKEKNIFENGLFRPSLDGDL